MIFLRLLSTLPFQALRALSTLCYLALYYLAGYRKQVVQDNLRHAFPDKNASELTSLEKKFYRQLTQVAGEIIKTRRMTQDDFRERVRFLNPGLLRELSNNLSDSVIITTIHQGNWEWMMHGLAATLGVPVHPVYKPLHNATMDEFMLGIRSQFGASPIAVAQAGRDILRHRREFRLLGLVGDQSPTPLERGVWTTFLNRPAVFHTGAARIARSAGLPLVFAQCSRRRAGYYDVEFHRLSQPPYGDDADNTAITEQFVRLAERAIKAEPESWLWSNRRWKRVPDGAEFIMKMEDSAGADIPTENE